MSDDQEIPGPPLFSLEELQLMLEGLDAIAGYRRTQYGLETMSEASMMPDREAAMEFMRSRKAEMAAGAANLPAAKSEAITLTKAKLIELKRSGPVSGQPGPIAELS